MIRDTLRAILAVAVVAAVASIGIETRYQLAAIDVAHRQTLAGSYVAAMPVAQPQQQPNRLRQLGRATLELADAALGIVR